MKEIKRKLAILESIWRNRFWDYDYLLKQIEYDKKLLSNYPGVAFGYLGDMLQIIEGYLQKDIQIKEDCFLPTIGLLQIIYIQQDLIDELLQVFGLQTSLMKDKDPNRTIRNDLAGHPIRRKRSKEEKGAVLKSYSLFSYEATTHNIQYLRYRQETNFAFELQEHNVSDIIKKHKEFLCKYLDLIFQKAISILKKFSKLNKELLSIHSKIDFLRLIEQVDIRFNYFFKEDYVFEKEYIIKCWQDKEQHPRYRYAIDKFNTDLSEMLTGVITSIRELEKEWNKPDQNYTENDTVEFEESLFFVIEPDSTDNTTYLNEAGETLYDDENPLIFDKSQLIDHYELGKLYTNHPIYGIEHFKQKYAFDSEIILELENMNKYIGRNEFYCSYNYFRDVLLLRHI